MKLGPFKILSCRFSNYFMFLAMPLDREISGVVWHLQGISLDLDKIQVREQTRINRDLASVIIYCTTSITIQIHLFFFVVEIS